MNHSTQTVGDHPNSSHPLDLDLVRPHLQQLARTTVNKTLQQARASGTDPVLGSSSALATFYMMMPRNDGRAQEEVIKIIGRLIKGLNVISSDLRFAVEQSHLDLIHSNDVDRITGLRLDYDPNPMGQTYKPDVLVINGCTGQACLLEFKRQVATIETTKLNRIADSLIVSCAQVRDYIYKKHRRRTVEPDVRWAIIDCSDQDLPGRFADAGVLGLDSLDVITGVPAVATAYRLTRDYMASEFCRGEAELMQELKRFVPAQTVSELIEEAVWKARMSLSSDSFPVVSENTEAACDDDHGDWLPEHPGADVHDNDRQDTSIIQFPPGGHIPRRRYGMFGT